MSEARQYWLPLLALVEGKKAAQHFTPDELPAEDAHSPEHVTRGADVIEAAQVPALPDW